MINRTKVNKNQVSASNPARSGFNLSYDSYNDYILGRVHVSGYHQVMPASKFSGHNKGDFMFNLVGTEFVAPIDGSQFNVAVSLRSIDNTFEDAFAPTKENAMSANWHAPTIMLNDLIRYLLNNLIYGTSTDWFKIFDTNATSVTKISDIPGITVATFLDEISNLSLTAAATQDFEHHYMLDILSDYYLYAHNIMRGITGNTTLFEARYLFFLAYLKPFFGESSLLDELGYIIVRNEDAYLLFDGDGGSTGFGGVNSFADIDVLADYFDSTPQNEYFLRGYYAIWYQLLRDPNLEPVSSTLPKWKQFGSSSVITLPMLLHRCHGWYEDMYVSGQPDDMMRHVYAPIINNMVQGSDDDNTSVNVQFPTSSFDYNLAEDNPIDLANQRNITFQTLTWRDSLSGSTRYIDCPLPALVNDSLRSINDNSDVWALDLYNLRQAQALERYLKRNFYFGDEYKERMLAHYGSEVSDNRLNYPTLLSSSLNAANQDRLVNNTETAQSVAGTRNVNMTIQTSGDGYESFAEEFTMIFNLISFIPRPQYSGASGFNLLYRQTDYPIPEFAANNEELSRIVEISCSGLSKDIAGVGFGKQTFAHHPYAHIWRSRVDEAHGVFRSSKSACLFTRYFSSEDGNPDTFPKLNYQFIHCRPNLRMFLNTIRLDGQLTGDVSHDFYCECPLPVPVESI